MIAYHNTNAEFTKFSHDFVGKSDYGYAGKGFYFTSKPISGVYGKKTIKVNLDLRSPLRRTDENWNKSDFFPYRWIPNRAEQLQSEGLNFSDAKNLAAKQWTEEAISRGYDGFIDECSGGGEIVAFYPEQIEILEATVLKNPPSPDFEELGLGSAAAAYRNKNLVEIITKSKRKRYDISRDIVIEARNRLPESLKKYLPIIHRKRIDKNKSGTLEFIYEMPFYNKVSQGPDEPEKYTNYRKYGYEYPSESELYQIESVLDTVMREAFAKAGLPYVRKDAKFDGTYEHQDSLTCNPPFNLGWYSEGNRKIIVFRDPLFAWMPVESVLQLFGSKFPENKANRVAASDSLLARYLKGCLL